MTTIQDVARVSGVSVTTVSHVLNHTRFVSPKLTRQVLDAVQELDYHALRKKTGKTYFNTPNSIGLIVSRNLLMSSGLRSYVKMSYHSDWITIPSNREITVEKLLYIKKFYRCNKIIVHPSIDLINSNKRFFNDANIILVNQDKLPKESEAVELSLDYFTAAILALEYLTENNHSSIKIVASHLNSCCKKQIQSAADVFAKKNNIPMREDNTIFLEDGERYDVESAFKDNTAVVTVGLGALHAVINYSVMNHIEIPSELSLVSIDDDSFIENTYPEITSVDVNPDALSGMILSNPVDFSRTIANPLLKIRKSVTYLPVDPFGRAASRADVLTLTSTEKILIRKRCPVIGVSFFDAGTLYSEKVFSGIQEACANLSLKLLPVQDAKRNTDFEHQQLISLIHQGAEVLISVSNNHDNMVNAFTQIAHKFRIPLILGTHLPVNLFDYCYETCIATNEEEKGRQIAAFLAEEMGRKHQSKVLFMIDQNSSIGAENCASAALTTISAHYPNLEVASEIININSFRGSGTFRNVFSNCREIEGFYVQDATIACNLYQYLISNGREDVTIVTGQINNRLARHILLKNIESLGIVSSRPIEMGHWMAYAAASVILNKDVPRYVTVDPIVLDRENIEGLWQTLTQNKLV